MRGRGGRCRSADVAFLQPNNAARVSRCVGGHHFRIICHSTCALFRASFGSAGLPLIIGSLSDSQEFDRWGVLLPFEALSCPAAQIDGTQGRRVSGQSRFN